MRLGSWLATATLVGQLVGAAAPAWASPGEDDHIDGAAFAGVTAPHPGNVTGNPAALLRLPAGTHAFLYGSGRLDRIAIDRRLVDPSGATRPGPTVSDSNPTAGGTLGAASFIAPKLLLAAALAWRPAEDTITRDATGYQSRGDHGRRFDYPTVAIAYRVLDRLSIGLSVSYTGKRQLLGFDRDTALEAGSDPARGVGSDCGGVACGLEHPLARQRWALDVRPETWSDNLHYAIGVVVQPAPDLWIGLATERPWQLGAITMTGSVVINEAPRDGGGTRTGRASVEVFSPTTWRLGVRGRIARGWDAVGEVRLRRLSRVGPYDLHTFGGDLAAGGVPEWYPRPRGLSDALAGWVGLEQTERTGDGLPIRFGVRLGGDTGAVDPARLSSTSPWGAELAGALGVQARLRSRWVVVAGAQLRYQIPTSTGASAFDPLDRIACVDSGYDYALPACAGVRDGYGLPTAAGDYRRTSLIANLGLRVELP